MAMKGHEDILNREVLTLEEQCRLLKAIYKSLAGDPLDPDNQGMVRKVDDHGFTLYGSENPKKIGLETKVDVLWEDRVKLIAICGVIGVVCGFLGWLLPFLFHR